MAPTLTFTLSDPTERYRAVRLITDIELARRPELSRNGQGWTLELPSPPVHRLEYLFEVEHPDGGHECFPDPENPERAPGAFGEKSVLLIGDYQQPWWLATEHAQGEHVEVALASRALRTDMALRVWSPAGEDGPLPLLIANDGPEYDELSALTTYAAAVVGTDELRPFRVALLPPGDRDEWYSASAAYSRALVTEIVPAIRSEVLVAGEPVGMGASMGGLAMLHAHRRYRGAFSGLFLQSSSFFVPRLDSHESRFGRWQRVVRFVRGTLATERAEDAIPVAITCGTAEENRHNNRVMADALARQGYDVTHHEIPDTHNYTAWRDAFDPYLTDLLVRAWWR